MEERTNLNENEETQTPEEVLADLKANSVPKKDYEALQAKYNNLFRMKANGTFAEETYEKTEAEKVKEFNENVMNIKNKKTTGSYEQMKSLVEIDDYYKEKTGKSIFAPSRGDLDDDGVKTCEALHDLLKNCVDISEGSNEVASAYFANAIDTRGIK